MQEGRWMQEGKVRQTVSGNDTFVRGRVRRLRRILAQTIKKIWPSINEDHSVRIVEEEDSALLKTEAVGRVSQTVPGIDTFVRGIVKKLLGNLSQVMKVLTILPSKNENHSVRIVEEEDEELETWATEDKDFTGDCTQIHNRWRKLWEEQDDPCRRR